ncbi:MAG: hypothetical protein ACLFPE_15570 [Bacteroidales bacterium]
MRGNCYWLLGKSYWGKVAGKKLLGKGYWKKVIGEIIGRKLMQTNFVKEEKTIFLDWE